MMRSIVRRVGPVMFAVGAIALSGCRDPMDDGLRQLGQFALRLSQSATTDNDPVTVTFVNILLDSRCPTDVECVWQGDAAAEVHLSVDGSAFTDTLHLNVDPREVTHGDYTIRFVKLDPAPISTQEIDPDDYVATFKISKKEE
jgi:hypothetical protein